MKKLFSLFLAVILCILSVSAYATSATHTNTQAFLALMDSYDITYTVAGVDDDGDEKVRISNHDDDNNLDYNIVLFFHEDNELVSMRVWNLVDFDQALLPVAYQLCNTLNYEYKFVTFYADESDNSITASMDVIVRPDSSMAEIAKEAMFKIVNIITSAYPTLAPLCK